MLRMGIDLCALTVCFLVSCVWMSLEYDLNSGSANFNAWLWNNYNISATFLCLCY